uniref:Uncharacterized protein AlNc14C101G6057 n=1 Tax=Albugo laibachii Nc14 TaxID=890382 RepID=F0WHJ4_9STRA|nr:conserved hypothetical protein [Albugo laibachii Nc14]|eukprot:CCA20713.1 conserved hypothetical protein [Albugo laibachii Nc14]
MNTQRRDGTMSELPIDNVKVEDTSIPCKKTTPTQNSKKEEIVEVKSEHTGNTALQAKSVLAARKDTLGWIGDDFLGMISHTPPAFSPGSLTMPMTKRGRSGSISSRLLSASDLEGKGLIDTKQKGVMKDLIISGDEALQKALEKFDAGDTSSLEALLDSGRLNRKSSSVDILDDLDLGFLNVGSLGDTPKHEDQFPATTRNQTLDDWDELGIFEPSFTDASRDLMEGDFYGSSLGASLSNSLPSLGLGITPPAVFGLGEEFLDSHSNSKKQIEKEERMQECKDHHRKRSQSASKSVLKHGDTSLSSVMGSSFASMELANSASSKPSGSRPIGIPGTSGGLSVRPHYGENSIAAGSGMPHANHNTVLNGLTSVNVTGVRSNDTNKEQRFVGAYSPESRQKRIQNFLDKRQKRVWRKEVKYDVRKNFADSRLRVKGRFVKKEDEQLLRELMSFT